MVQKTICQILKYICERYEKDNVEVIHYKRPKYIPELRYNKEDLSNQRENDALFSKWA